MSYRAGERIKELSDLGPGGISRWEPYSTGRRWDGDSVSVRDRVRSHPSEMRFTETSSISRGKEGRRGKAFEDLRFRRTWDIIEAADKGLLPDKIMLNTHPQRWTDNRFDWTKELVWQNVKNVVKRIVIRRLHGLGAEVRGQK